MDSLGILFQEDGAYLMRSPNVLRLLGSQEQVEEQLVESTELQLPQRFQASSFRGPRATTPYRRSPFTHQQVADLLERRNQLRVIVGSPALGVEDAVPVVEELVRTENQSHELFVISPDDPKRLLSRLKQTSRRKHRIVVYRIAEDADNEALEHINAAAERIANSERSVAAMFLVGSDALPVWRRVLAPPLQEEQTPRLEIVELKRWDRAGLRAWAQSQDVDLPFSDEQSLQSVMDATGGWPILVDRLVTAYTAAAAKRNWRKALADFAAWLESPEGADEFCASLDVHNDADAAAAWEEIVSWEEYLSREDFQQLASIGGERAAVAYELLRSLQVLEFSADGRFRAERTAARAWARRASS